MTIRGLISRIMFLYKGVIDKSRLSNRLRKSGQQLVWFIDIDNTIADTWPTLLQKWPSEIDRLRSIPPHTHMVRFLQEKYEQENFIAVFLTARSWNNYAVTKTWLKEHGLRFPDQQLYIVPHPAAKVSFLKWALKAGKTVVYLDDLSGGHETGQVKLYTDVIRTVEALNLTYLGKDFIDDINHQN